MEMIDGSYIRLDLGANQWLIDSLSNVVEQPDLVSVDGPLIVVSDFSNAPADVESIKGKKAHCEALLDRSLRDRGESDDSSQVVMLDIKSRMGTHEVLYTAIPTQLQKTLLDETLAHSDHGLLYSIWSLLSARSNSISEQNSAVCFRTDDQLYVLVKYQGVPAFASKISIHRNTEDDWYRAFTIVESKLKALDITDIDKVEWHTWVDISEDDGQQTSPADNYSSIGFALDSSSVVAEAPNVESLFEQKFNFTISKANCRKLSLGNKVIESSVHDLLSYVSVNSALSDNGAKLRFVSESIVKFVFPASLVLSLGMLLLSVYFAYDKSLVNSEIERIKSNIDFAEIENKQDYVRRQNTPQNLTVGGLLGRSNESHIKQILSLSNDYSINKVLTVIKYNKPRTLKINRVMKVGVENSGNTPKQRIVVYGHVNDDSIGSTNDMNKYVARLKKSGFVIESHQVAIEDGVQTFSLQMYHSEVKSNG